MYCFERLRRIPIGSDGWLDPFGAFFPCKSTEHDESAEYLVENLPLVKSLAHSTFKYRSDFEKWKELNAREKLRRFGFVLINGPILRTEKAANYDPRQLEALKVAGIPIRSAFDVAVEFSSAKILSKVNEVIKLLDENPALNKVRGDLENGRYSLWFRGALESTMSSLLQFREQPLRTSIMTMECYDWHDPDQHMVLPASIFADLSSGFDDEMVMLDGRSTITYRVVSFGGHYLLAEWCMYSHDGLSGGMMGDYNNYLSVKVIDDKSFSDDLKVILDRNRKYYKDYPVKITLSHKGEFFERIVGSIVF